jgi:formylglycine-generating enzyme required for sulfatase activity
MFVTKCGSSVISRKRLIFFLILVVWFWGRNGVNGFLMGEQPEVIVNSAGISMVRVPSGSFANRRGASITFTYDFYIGTTEVTRSQYKAIMGEYPSSLSAIESEDEYKNHPAVGLTYRDARKFCWELSQLPDEKKERKKYRLPREFEWERSCLAGSNTKYFWGDDASRFGEFGWYKENAGGTAHPVATKKPNPWGLYDVHGNVWEMMEDYDDRYLEKDSVDPRGPFYGPARVIRGGSFLTEIDDPRELERTFYGSDRRSESIGFRIVAIIDNSAE